MSYPPLQPGDYYIENGKWVFTAQYPPPPRHLLRQRLPPLPVRARQCAGR
jgi:hypothetical protein